MTKRITKSILQTQLDSLNSKLYTQLRLDLDYAQCYGGYCLTSHNNSVHTTLRMSGKELHQYLNGALDWITSIQIGWDDKDK